jgi:hypothetical protein
MLMMNLLRAPLGGGGVALTLTLAFATSGCGGPHVILKVPEADAPADERISAYERLSPRRMRVRMVTTKRGAFTSSYSEIDYLQLGDKTRVRHVVDLLPAVEATSPTAESIRESKSNANVARWLLFTGLGAIVGGFALTVNDFASHPTSRGVGFYAGAGVGIAGIIALPTAVFFSGKAGQAKQQAMKSYDNDLLQRLDLCAGEDGAVPCP